MAPEKESKTVISDYGISLVSSNNDPSIHLPPLPKRPVFWVEQQGLAATLPRRRERPSTDSQVI